MLRAVAIENSKDADTAVEVVLTEVIPYLSKGTQPHPLALPIILGFCTHQKINFHSIESLEQF